MILGLSLLLGYNVESSLVETRGKFVLSYRPTKKESKHIDEHLIQIYGFPTKKMMLNFHRLVCCQGVFLGNDDNHLICYHNHIILSAFHLWGWKALQQLLLRLLSIEGSVLLASAELRRPFLNAFVEELFEVSWLGSILRWWYFWSSYLYIYIHVYIFLYVSIDFSRKLVDWYDGFGWSPSRCWLREIQCGPGEALESLYVGVHPPKWWKHETFGEALITKKVP